MHLPAARWSSAKVGAPSAVTGGDPEQPVRPFAAACGARSRPAWRGSGLELADSLHQDQAAKTSIEDSPGQGVVERQLAPAWWFIGVDGYRWMIPLRRPARQGTIDTSRSSQDALRGHRRSPQRAAMPMRAAAGGTAGADGRPASVQGRGTAGRDARRPAGRHRAAGAAGSPPSGAARPARRCSSCAVPAPAADPQGPAASARAARHAAPAAPVGVRTRRASPSATPRAVRRTPIPAPPSADGRNRRGGDDPIGASRCSNSAVRGAA